jgi:N-acetyl-anhydromuramyl-L-alanine amidase AmpD
MEITNFKEFKPVGKQKKKKQIILVHSGRPADDYLQKLKYRNNGDYNKIPNYVIKLNGEIVQLLENNEHTIFFDEMNINRNSITICLENLGWLVKEPLTNHYVNWIGDIYKGEVYVKKWRDYYFWHPYSDEQIIALGDLCKLLFKENGIKNHIIGHNTKINDYYKVEGVLTKSNIDSKSTEVSPAFDFNKLIKTIENE